MVASGGQKLLAGKDIRNPRMPRADYLLRTSVTLTMSDRNREVAFSLPAFRLRWPPPGTGAGTRYVN